MADYFFDTSVLIAFLAREDTRTVALIDEVLQGDATAGISALTVAELWAPAAMSDQSERDRRAALVGLLQVYPIDQRVAEHAGDIRRQFGLRIPDALIVACAQAAGGRFLSKNQHFRRVLEDGVLAGEVYV